MRLVTCTQAGEMIEGECSRRQLAIASEGRCPHCGSDVLERTSDAGKWTISWEWARCPDCCWAMAFSVMVLKDDAQPSLVRVLP